MGVSGASVLPVPAPLRPAAKKLVAVNTKVFSFILTHTVHKHRLDTVIMQQKTKQAGVITQSQLWFLQIVASFPSVVVSKQVPIHVLNIFKDV